MISYAAIITNLKYRTETDSSQSVDTSKPKHLSLI